MEKRHESAWQRSRAARLTPGWKLGCKKLSRRSGEGADLVLAEQQAGYPRAGDTAKGQVMERNHPKNNQRRKAESHTALLCGWGQALPHTRTAYYNSAPPCSNPEALSGTKSFSFTGLHPCQEADAELPFLCYRVSHD